MNIKYRQIYTSSKYIVLLIALIILPLIITQGYWLYMLTMLGIYAMLTASLDLQYGYTGMINIAHASFFGIGAYSCGVLQTNYEINFWLALVLSVIITLILSIIIGYPMLRIKGPYFTLGTLALAFVAVIIIHNWHDLTGGYSLIGIQGPAPINIFNLEINFRIREIYYYLILIFAFLTIFIIRRLANSRVGRAFIAIREDQELAEANGVNIFYYKMLSFAISSGFAALTGAFYAGYLRALEPAIAGPHTSFQVLVMAIVGGPTTVTGYLVGPFLIWVLPDLLGFAEAYRPLMFGMILILVVIFLPQGIGGALNGLYGLLISRIKSRGANDAT